MFEEMDIADMLRGKKAKKSDSEKKPEPPPERTGSPLRQAFDEFRRETGGMGNDHPSEADIKKLLEEKFGGHVEILGGGLAAIGGGGKEFRLKQEGMIQSLAFLAQAMKIPPTCADANGAELVAGDVLKVPGGETKIVLKVGWKFAVLSRTDDHAKPDGAWFENQISDMNFIKE